MTFATLDVVLALAATPLVLAAAYLALLAALSGDSRPRTRRAPRVRLDVVVPAHDEAALLGPTISRLLACDYPRNLFRVWVVADNCTDETADVALMAGARVLVRSDTSRRSKGDALAWAFERLLVDDFADAFVVVDADSLASRDLLAALAARVADGAPAVQARYGVRNPQASWRTRLMSLAFCLMHDVRSRARERLGLSCGLRGNGMLFTRASLTAVPYQACSLTEDIEYGIHLALAGRRVHFAPEAQVLGEMPRWERAARSQRRRWEEGRRALRRLYAGALVRQGLAARSPMLLDLAADLLVPPLSTLVTLDALGLATTLIAITLGARLILSAALLGAGSLCLVAYVARGWRVSGGSLSDLLRWAPVFLGWKLGLRFTRRLQPSSAWVRTDRERVP